MAPFTKVTGQQVKKSLARSFVPLADQLRDLLTKFGLRTYQVSLVRVQWSGGRRGVGAATVKSQTVLEPTPKIGDLNGLTEILTPIGLNDQGSILLTQISGRYTEEELLGLDEYGNDIPLDEEFFYEIEFPRTDGKPSEMRRFFPRSVPSYKPGGLQWTVRLEKANEDRDRNGDPE